jgi:Tfp pilus tip-associated adhesin PilY1
LDYEHDSLTTDSVGILGDMVNSGITVVGKPKHKSLINNDAINNRDPVVYVQTNRGVVHAFNYINGNEVWGFIPPNIFQHKIKNLKFEEINRNNWIWINGNGLTRARSNPMVLLDGMLVAKDVENRNAAITLLTGYLGQGGNGFYAMDITEMDASQKPPVFMWAIENARYGDEEGTNLIDDRIKRWGRALRSDMDISNYDYRDLGLTIVPGVYFTPAKGSNDTIGVLPGGLGHKLGVNDSQGKVFYFFNPINGSIMRKIDTSQNSLMTGFEAPVGVKLGMGISPIIYHENGYKKAVAFYTADSEGNVMQCDMERDNLPLWKLKSIFQLRTLGSSFPYENGVGVPPVGGLAVAIPRKMVLARSKNNYSWIFGGTSDLYAPESAYDELKMLINKEQFIFGLNTSNLLKSAELNSGITPSNANVRKMPYYIDDIPDKYGKYGIKYVHEDELGIKHGMNDYGWVIRLRPKFGITEAEYLSSDPFLMNNVLYVATFISYAGSISEEACSDIGVGKLYALDPSTGRSVMEDSPSIVLENVKIVSISGNPAKNNLVLSVKELKAGAMEGNSSKLSNTTNIGNGLFEINAPGGKVFEPGAGPEFDFEELVPHIQYWSEKFK